MWLRMETDGWTETLKKADEQIDSRGRSGTTGSSQEKNRNENESQNGELEGRNILRGGLTMEL